MTPELAQPNLDRACRSLGYAGTPELVGELARAVERGHHIALIAGEGSGSELLFGLAVSHVVVEDREDLQALVLTATPERAARCARAIHAVGRARGLEALVWPPRSTSDETRGARGRQIIVGRPEHLLSSVRTGELGIASLRLLIIDDVVALEGAWSVVETLLGACTPDTQKIACAHAASERLGELLDRQLPRARQWPAELFPAPGAEPGVLSKGGPPVRYACAAGEEALLRRLGEALHEIARSGRGEHAAIRCLSPEVVPRVEASLVAEGFRLASNAKEAGVRVGVEPHIAGEQIDVAVMFGLPPGVDVLRTALAGGAIRVAVVESRHAAQLELAVQRLGWRLEPVGSELSRTVSDELERFRTAVRSEMDRADLGGALLILEPLIEEFGAEAVAGALASLLRRRDAASDAGGDSGTASPDANVERIMRRAWTRVWVGVGKRDGVGPGDLVGAITGETAAQGAQIGRIEVRGSYSLVEVDSQVADEVVRNLRGTRIKGRDAAVRLDREKGTGSGRRQVN